MEEAAALAKLQQEDDSLVELRRKGSEQEDGYMSDKNGVLVQTKFIVPGREVRRMVVPIPRRREVLEITHKGLVGGHYSQKRW